MLPVEGAAVTNPALKSISETFLDIFHVLIYQIFWQRHYHVICYAQYDRPKGEHLHCNQSSRGSLSFHNTTVKITSREWSSLSGRIDADDVFPLLSVEKGDTPRQEAHVTSIYEHITVLIYLKIDCLSF